MDMFGPRRSYSMETKPLAMLLIIMAMVKGDTREGPRSNSRRHSSSMLLRPPIPLPTITPKRSWFTVSRSIPESASAIFAAAIANCAKRSARRASLGELKYLVGSKPLTSPAILQSYVVRVERLVFGHATPAFGQVFPEGIEVAADRADDTDSGDDYSAFAHRILLGLWSL